MKTILLFGKDGQVGRELQRSLAPLGKLIAVGRQNCNLTDVDTLRSLIRQVHPAVIVNAAAYTAVDKAEDQADICGAINRVAPGVMAEEAKRMSACLVHYSTDYVFSGQALGSYVESDATGPLNVYGVTKLEGEQAVQQSGCVHFIFRTSWVYSRLGGNFINTVLRLAREREALRMIHDQWGAPTSAALIADVTSSCLQKSLGKNDHSRQSIFHLAAAGETNWHSYAQFIVAKALEAGYQLKCQPQDIMPISSTEYPLPAKRPANSRLDTSRLRQEFQIPLRDWRYYVERSIRGTTITESAS